MTWYLFICITAAGIGCQTSFNTPMPDLNTCTSVLAFSKTDARYATAIATCTTEPVTDKSAATKKTEVGKNK